MISKLMKAFRVFKEFLFNFSSCSFGIGKLKMNGAYKGKLKMKKVIKLWCLAVYSFTNSDSLPEIIF